MAKSKLDEKTDPPGMFSLNEPIDGSAVDASTPVTFRWSPSPEADSYRIEIRKSGKTPSSVESDGLKEPEFTAKLDPGCDYLWTVSATNRYGVKKPSVAPFRFRTN